MAKGEVPTYVIKFQNVSLSTCATLSYVYRELCGKYQRMFFLPQTKSRNFEFLTPSGTLLERMINEAQQIHDDFSEET